MKYLKSFHSYELRFRLPSGEVILPRRSYKAAQVHAGKRNVVALSDRQLAELMLLKVFRALLARGKGTPVALMGGGTRRDGGYVLMDDLPDHEKTVEQRLTEAQERANKAEAKLAALRGRPAATLVEEQSVAGDLADGAVAQDKPLSRYSNVELREAMVDAGLDPAGKSRKDMVAQLLEFRETRPQVTEEAGDE